MAGVACGKDGGGNPASASPTTTSIQINGPSTIDVGSTLSYSAVATLSNGSTRPVSGGAWGTDAPLVVSVNAGQVTALAPGLATIWVDSDGRRGTLLVTARVNFTGTWRGNYRTTSCSEDLLWALIDFCDTLLNATLQVTVAMTQNGNSVGGTLSFGQIDMQASGSVDASGLLRLNGTTTASSGTRISLLSWESRLQGNVMEGNFRQRWQEPTTLQAATFDATLLSLPKISGLAVSPASAISSGAGREQPEQLLQRLLRR